MAAVSVLAFSRVKVRDVEAGASAGEEMPDVLAGVDAEDEAVAAGLEGAFADDAGVGDGADEGVDGAWDGADGGFDPPMLREMVGAGAGASVCSGRSTGFRGGDGCWAGGGMRKVLPGTNSNAPALSLLIVKGDEGRVWATRRSTRSGKRTAKSARPSEPHVMSPPSETFHDRTVDTMIAQVSRRRNTSYRFDIKLGFRDGSRGRWKESGKTRI